MRRLNGWSHSVYAFLIVELNCRGETRAPRAAENRPAAGSKPSKGWALFCCAAQGVSGDEFPDQGVEVGAAKVVAVPHVLAAIKPIMVDHGAIVATGIQGALNAAGDVCDLGFCCDVVLVFPIVHGIDLAVVIGATFIGNRTVIGAVALKIEMGRVGAQSFSKAFVMVEETAKMAAYLSLW